MVITFYEQKKRQQYLFLVFLSIILIVVLVAWYGFFWGFAPKLPPTPIKPKEIKISWETLQDSRIQNLSSFEGIAPLEEAAGRSNPFLPYQAIQEQPEQPLEELPPE